LRLVVVSVVLKEEKETVWQEVLVRSETYAAWWEDGRMRMLFCKAE
jgi:hypothetical protein